MTTMPTLPFPAWPQSPPALESLAVDGRPWSCGVLTGAGMGKMKHPDTAGREPALQLEKYFDGSVRAWGLFEDRFGRVRRQFTVDIVGDWNGTRLRLDEHFQYDDGEIEQRVWIIHPLPDGCYDGAATDIVGLARGRASGNTVVWNYVIDLKIGTGRVRVRFRDRMYLLPDGVLINRAQVQKWGIELGQVTLCFRKPPPKAAA